MIYVNKRNYSVLDSILNEFNHALRMIFGLNAPQRQSPAIGIEEGPLSGQEQQRSAKLMRVNHSGEIAAQALYRGQAICSKNPEQQQKLRKAANEEIDHLSWCERRLNELNGQPSRLTPLWYTGSFVIGALAGIAGDRWSLGFVEETEHQVSDHLENHIRQLPEQDHKSRAIIRQMREDEITHAQWAAEAGARELPGIVKNLMQKTARIMTGISFHI